MPQIICKGLKEEEVVALSSSMSKEFSKIMDCPEDWFLFEFVERKCYVQGKKLENDPMIDIYYFDRGQEIQDQCALALDKAIRELGYEQIEIHFHFCLERCYYENGKHY